MQVELAGLWSKSLAGGVDNLPRAVFPCFEFGTGQGTVLLGETEKFGHRCYRHGVSEGHQRGLCGFEDRFLGWPQPELLKGAIHEAVGHGCQGSLEAREVVEEGPSGNACAGGDVLHREIAGAVAAEKVKG